MAKDYTNRFLLETLRLPVIKDLYSLSDNLGLSTKVLYLLSTQSNNYYKSFTIKKRNGTDREIVAPSYSLKLVQKWILNEILEKIKISDIAIAYKKGKGSRTKENAEFHKYSLFILELDIKNFFTSIPRKRVFFLFKNVGYNILVSNILANLCTYNGYLPQGGVCSPYVSNLICRKLDRRINGYCSKRDIIYTRYADDLSFSCDNKHLLNKVLNVIEIILRDEGFEVNNTKTKLLSPASHKRVTGVTVNDNNVKASKELKRKVRAMIHRSIVTKDYSHNDIIRGYISYIKSIEGEDYKDLIINYINKIANKEDYIYCKDMVLAFNNNKILKQVKNISYDDSVMDEELYNDVYYERQNYIEKINSEVATTNNND